MKVVVDATVLIRCIVPGKETDACRKWLSTAQALCAPRLIWYEVTSALKRLEYLNILDAATVDYSLHQLSKLPVTLSGSKSLYQQMVQLARTLSVSRTYDMTYLALALEEDCPLITLDERLIRHAGEHGYRLYHPANCPNPSLQTK